MSIFKQLIKCIYLQNTTNPWYWLLKIFSNVLCSLYDLLCCLGNSFTRHYLGQGSCNMEDSMLLSIECDTCSFHCSDSLHLLEHRGEGIGNDSDHDQDSEEKDQKGGQDELDILPCDISVCVCLLERSLATSADTGVAGVQGGQRSLGGEFLVGL